MPDDLDGVLERLLAHADADSDAVTDCLPAEWDDASSVEPVLGYGRCEPSGWLALDLDSATADPARLSDDTLIEAMIGFDRVGSWAAARQARLLAELARRRPTDKAPYSARWACVGSEYAPDEVGGRPAPGPRHRVCPDRAGAPDRTDGLADGLADGVADGVTGSAGSIGSTGVAGRPIQPVTSGKPLIQVVISWAKRANGLFRE